MRTSVFKRFLNEVFRDMRKRGICAKQNFTCCQTCGCAEMDAFIKPRHHGYCFYHAQDADDIKNGYVYLSYGGATERDNSEAVGRQICDILRSYGLGVEWDGSHETRIKAVSK